MAHPLLCRLCCQPRCRASSLPACLTTLSQRAAAVGRASPEISAENVQRPRGVRVVLDWRIVPTLARAAAAIPITLTRAGEVDRHLFVPHEAEEDYVHSPP